MKGELNRAYWLVTSAKQYLDPCSGPPKRWLFARPVTANAVTHTAWYTGKGPEQGFWHCFTDEHNQKFTFVYGTG